MNVDGKGLGRLPAADARDRQYLMRELVPAEVSLPDRYYYRTGVVLDQGDTPTCVGHAWRQFLSSALLMSKSGPDAFAIYHAAQLVDEWPSEDYAGTSVRAGARVLKAMGRLREYRWAWHVNDVKTWLLAGKGTVVLGTDWYDGFGEPDRHGFVHMSGRVRGGHAFLAVGYSDKLGAFRCLNSWGAEYGQRGRFWLPGEYLEKLINDNGEACTAVEAPA